MAAPLYKGAQDAALTQLSHRGLWYDKFYNGYDREWRVPGPDEPGNAKLDWIRGAILWPCGEPEQLTTGTRRISRLAESLGGKAVAYVNTWRFVSGLGIKHPVENGFQWHPTLGVPYLPGCAVKGLCRSWMERQAGADSALKSQIERIFGHDPHVEHDEDDRTRLVTGSMVFFDALPLTPVALCADVMTPHMGHWYSDGRSLDDAKIQVRRPGGDSPTVTDNAKLPGDWHDPTPVPFLVAKNITLQFAIAPRAVRATADYDAKTIATSDLGAALRALDAALVASGAGAKTVANYGRFRLAGAKAPAAELTPDQRLFEIALQTPAFLGGAEASVVIGQRVAEAHADCELRVPTLRGALRWWWRAMHAEHLPYELLHRLEASVWGSTDAASPVQITLEPIGSHEVVLCQIKEPYTNSQGQQRLRFDRRFAQAHGITLKPQVTPGYAFLTYGMDDQDRAKRQQRHFLAPGARWNIRIRAQALFLDKVKTDGDKDNPLLQLYEISPELLLEQAHAALRLLCTYGGVGAKSRNGLGSLRLVQEVVLNGEDVVKDVERAGDRLRKSLRLTSRLKQAAPQTASFKDAELLQLEFKAGDAWHAIDKIGCAYRDFTQADTCTGHGKHCPEKACLGLPRLIQLQRQKVALESPVGKRHTKPFFFHLENLGPVGGNEPRTWRFRAAALPSPWLYPSTGATNEPSFERSRTMLAMLLKHIKHSL